MLDLPLPKRDFARHFVGVFTRIMTQFTIFEELRKSRNGRNGSRFAHSVARRERENQKKKVFLSNLQPTSTLSNVDNNLISWIRMASFPTQRQRQPQGGQQQVVMAPPAQSVASKRQSTCLDFLLLDLPFFYPTFKEIKSILTFNLVSFSQSVPSSTLHTASSIWLLILIVLADPSSILVCLPTRSMVLSQDGCFDGNRGRFDYWFHWRFVADS